MGLVNDITNFLNSLANFKKVQVEETKAQTQKAKMKRITKENIKLKKALSKNQIIGITSIFVTIAVAVISILLVYFPILNTS